MWTLENVHLKCTLGSPFQISKCATENSCLVILIPHWYLSVLFGSSAASACTGCGRAAYRQQYRISVITANNAYTSVERSTGANTHTSASNFLRPTSAETLDRYGRPAVLAEPAILFSAVIEIFLFSPPNIRGRSVYRHQTLSHVRRWTRYSVGNLASQKHQNFGKISDNFAQALITNISGM